jgi:predicted nucleic acid-binding protein
VKPQPDEIALDRILSFSLFDVFVSVISIGELWSGITKLRESKRRNALENWFENDILKKYSERILPINKDIALIWGQIKSDSEKSGKSMNSMDMFISATAQYHNFTIVTRNTKDFINSGCKLFNPWE